MKIRITKNTMPLSWYKDRIGETFNVIRVDEKQRHYVVHTGRMLESFVRFGECEILNVEKNDRREEGEIKP